MFDRDREVANVAVSDTETGATLGFELLGQAVGRHANGAHADAQVGTIAVHWTSYVDRLKEDLVLTSRPEADQVQFIVRQVGLELQRDREGGYLARDAKGYIRFHILAPAVVDANGRTGKATLTIDNHAATITLDAAFLSSATYPLIVDPTSVYASAVLADGPSGYWRLAETTGTTAFDSSGNGNNGVITAGVTLGAPGALLNEADGAMTFDGTTGYISVGTTNGIPGGNQPYTIEGWMNPNGARNQTLQAIAAWGVDGTGGVHGFGPHTSTGLYGWGGGGSPYDLIVNGLPDAHGGWHHVAVTFNGKTRHVYLDTVLIVSDSPPTQNVSLANLTVGGFAGNWLFSGSLDEVAIYPTALSQPRLQAHYQASGRTLWQAPTPTGYATAVTQDSPVAYWRLDEPTGSFFARDYSGNGNDGVLRNGGVTPGTTGALVNEADRAMTFDGTTGYISVGTANGIPSGNQPYTIEGWMSPNGAGNQTLQAIAAWGVDSTGGVHGFGSHTSTGLFGWGGGGSPHDLIVNGLPDIHGAWHYIAVTFDGTTRRVYLDTVLIVSDSPPTENVSLANLTVGGFAGNWLFSGSLDEVAIYPTALSQPRLQAHYQASGRTVWQPPTPTGYAAAVAQDGPVGYWRLSEPAGSVFARDYSGRGNDGVLRNGGVSAGTAGAWSSETAMTFDGSTGYISVGTTRQRAPPLEIPGLTRDRAQNGGPSYDGNCP